MKSLIWVIAASVLVGGAGIVDHAEAGDKRKHDRDRRVERRYDDRRVDRRDHDRRDRYFGSRDVVIIREYYVPQRRAIPRGIRQQYYRTGYLPRGWAKRIHPIPVHVDRRLPALPRGYRRGIIDGHVVVHNSAGLILDVALLF